jgi:hypothetical protein
MMPLYAAYDDFSIYAVSDSPENAIAKARDDAREPEAEFSTAMISDELAAQIARDGWDGMHRSFEIGRDGFIVDTTNA